MTRADQLLRRIKNNKLVSIAIALGAIIIGVAGFTDTISKFPEAVGRIRSFVAGSPEKTDAERKLVMEVSHRANEALKGLQQDEKKITFENKTYPPEDIYRNVTHYLDNSFSGWSFSAFSEYRASSFQELILNLVALKGQTKQLQQASDAFQELDDLSNEQSESLPDAEQNKQRSLEAVAKATGIIKDKLINNYFKSSVNR